MVLTNDLPVAATLHGTAIDVVLTGGQLRSDSLDLTGQMVERAVRDYHVDLLVTGCDAARVHEGFYTSDMNLAAIERTSSQIAERVAVADRESQVRQPGLL